jgi:hypothetical protein
MDTKTWIIIVLAIALLLLGVSSWSSRPTPAEPMTATSTAATTTVQQTPKAPAPKTAPKSTQTYASLLTQPGSYQCDYDQVTASGQSHNVIYLSGGKLRAEFRTISGNVTAANLSIYDGHYLYSWKEGQSTGTKTGVTSLSQLPAAIPANLTSGKIYGNTYESVGWKCHAWIANNSILVPPSYVSFR